MNMRDVIHQTVKHHGIYGAAGPYYSAFSGAAIMRLSEGLSGKTSSPALFAQVAQAAMRDRDARSRMDRSSPENAGLIFAESMVKMLGSIKGQLESVDDVSIPYGTALPLMEGTNTITPAVIKRITQVLESMTGEYYDAEKVDGLVSAYDLDGTDGAHWLMEFVTRGRRPYQGYAVLLTNPRGKVFELGAGAIGHGQALNFNEDSFHSATRQAISDDQELYESEETLYEKKKGGYLSAMAKGAATGGTIGAGIQGASLVGQHHRAKSRGHKGLSGKAKSMGAVAGTGAVMGALAGAARHRGKLQASKFAQKAAKTRKRNKQQKKLKGRKVEAAIHEQYPPHIYGHAVEPWSHQQQTGAPSRQDPHMPPKRHAKPARKTRAGKEEHLQKRYEKSAEKMVSNLERMGKRFTAEERDVKMNQFIEHMWTMRNKWRKEGLEDDHTEPIRMPVYDDAYALNFEDRPQRTNMREGDPHATAEKMVKHVEKRKKGKMSPEKRAKMKAKFAKHAGKFAGGGKNKKKKDNGMGAEAQGAVSGPLAKGKLRRVESIDEDFRTDFGQALKVQRTKRGTPRRAENLDEDFKSDFRQAIQTQKRRKPELEADTTNPEQIWEAVAAKKNRAASNNSMVVAGPPAAQGSAESLWEAVQRNNNVDTSKRAPAGSQFDMPVGVMNDPQGVDPDSAQAMVESGDMDEACKTPGKKIRSKGKGRGAAVGDGRGPIGRPVGQNDTDEACKTPGKKIRSKGKGRGLARGDGEGPIGRPIGEAEFVELMRVKLAKQKGKNVEVTKITRDDGQTEDNTFPRGTGVDLGRVRRDEIYPRIFQSLQATPYKGNAADIAHAVEEIVVRERRHMHGIILSKDQIESAFTNLFHTPKVKSLMKVTSNNIPKMADVLGTVFVKEAHKQFQQGTPTGDIHEIVKSHMDPDFPPEPAPARVTPQAMKLMAMNGWTLPQALKFGRKFLASHGFSQRDILSMQSQHKLGTKEAE